ncbi:MAG: DUF2520 domain-containing protein [Gemmatimonadaceae bacterium]
MTAALPAVAIVGAGRLGTALAAALRATGAAVEGPLGRDDRFGSAEVVLLCVPDAAIAGAAAQLPAGRLVGHCSGATTLDPLAPHEAFSLHPLMTVSGGEALFAGAGCAIAGTTPRARETARALAAALGMLPFEVADDVRALYHAAASAASNFVVTLAGVAEALAARAGVPRERRAPLALAAVEHWATRGAAAALTGPIARGDEETVRRQRAAVEAHAGDALPRWDALADRTRALARTGAPLAEARGAEAGA